MRKQSTGLVIGLGYMGPTDSCLTLSDGKRMKEFLIESHCWSVLSRMTAGKKLPYTVPDGTLANEMLMYMLDRDTREQER